MEKEIFLESRRKNWHRIRQCISKREREREKYRGVALYTRLHCGRDISRGKTLWTVMKLETVWNSSIQQEIIPGEIDAGSPRYIPIRGYFTTFEDSLYFSPSFFPSPLSLAFLPIYLCPFLVADKSTQSTRNIRFGTTFEYDTTG